MDSACDIYYIANDYEFYKFNCIQFLATTENFLKESFSISILYLFDGEFIN